MSDDARDLSSERALLGAVLLAPESVGPILLEIPADAWWHPKNATIADVITSRLHRDLPVDPQLILTDLLGRHGFGADTGPYLLTLTEHAWAPSNAAYYAERILHCAARRNLSAAATRLRQRLDQSWANGYDEPVGEFTADMRASLDTAEAVDGGLDSGNPSGVLPDLLASTDEHNWLVPGLLERAERIVLTGSEGHGKSMLVAQIALTLAAGLHPFTGATLGNGDNSLRILYIDCENGMSQTRRRLRKIVGNLERGASCPDGWQNNVRLEIRPAGLDLLGRDAVWLDRRVAANSPDLLIIGPMYRLHYANLNEEQPARELVRVLDKIRINHGCALLTEAHPGHTEDASRVRRMRPAGSSLLMRWPEFGFGLRRAAGAVNEHPEIVDVIPWRGSREERQWPRQLKHGQFLPWEPADDAYLQLAG